METTGLFLLFSALDEKRNEHTHNMRILHKI